jgi:hypothetical protein
MSSTLTCPRAVRALRASAVWPEPKVIRMITPEGGGHCAQRHLIRHDCTVPITPEGTDVEAPRDQEPVSSALRPNCA